MTRGTDADGVAETEADHLMKVPACGELLRDPGQMLAHVHDAEIEIGEGLETPAAKWAVAVVRSVA